MYSKFDRYINTATDGLIFDIEHNLKTLSPLAFLYEPVGLSDLRSVSLYDSRIGFVESKGLNVTRISFNNPFEGYISLVGISNDKPDLETRVSRLETSLSNAIQQQKSFTTLSQWKEMNNLLEEGNQSIKDALTLLVNQVESLKEEVSNL